jgi:hypothetical protein
MCPVSGGYWTNSSNAGVWTLNLNNVRTNSNNNVGFRADSISPHGPDTGRSGIKGDAFRLAAVSAVELRRNRWASAILVGAMSRSKVS